MAPVEEHKQRITELALLMDEFRLSEARYQSGELSIAFRKRRKQQDVQEMESESSHETYVESVLVAEPQIAGVQVTSPMTGIFYRSSSPSSPVFLKEGDTVTAGQVIGLIEAMKVFNEIPSTASGTVLKIVAESGQLVQPGDPLLIVG